MKNTILLYFLFEIFILQAQTVQWANQQTLGESSLALSTCIDAQGNVYVAGNQSCTHNNPSACPNNIQNGGFIYKYNQSGTLVWSKVSSSFYVYDMVLNKDGEPLVLEASGFTQYDVNGNTIWTKNLLHTATNKIKCDANGDIYVAGLFNGTVNFSSSIQLTCPSNNNYLFVSKFDMYGNCIWAIQSVNFARLFNFKTDSIGNCYLSGHYQVELTLNGSTINTPGGYYSNGYIAKINNIGQVEWLNNIGDHIQGNEEVECIDIDSKGNVYATGNFFNAPLTLGGSTIGSASGGNFIAKFDKNGYCISAQEVNYRATSLETTNQDKLIFAGYGTNFHGNALSTNWQNGDGSFFIVKSDTNFTLDWVLQPTGKVGYRAIDDTYGNVYFFGNIKGNSSIGAYTLSGPPISPDNNSDMLLVKLSDNTFVGIKPTLQDIKSDLQIYPSPTSGELQVSYFSAEETDLIINILDSKGGLIFSETIRTIEGAYTRRFDLSKHPKGLYTFQFTSKKGHSVKRVLLQ
ncbi:MAG TPA: T9SS type A sorting domain-containing protein [Bacteroidia bacterium]|jgi:hypothetical protein